MISAAEQEAGAPKVLGSTLDSDSGAPCTARCLHLWVQTSQIPESVCKCEEWRVSLNSAAPASPACRLDASLETKRVQATHDSQWLSQYSYIRSAPIAYQKNWQPIDISSRAQ